LVEKEISAAVKKKRCNLRGLSGTCWMRHPPGLTCSKSALCQFY